MPLKKGASRKTVGDNIRALVHDYERNGTIGSSTPASKKKGGEAGGGNCARQGARARRRCIGLRFAPNKAISGPLPFAREGRRQAARREKSLCARVSPAVSIVLAGYVDAITPTP